MLLKYSFTDISVLRLGGRYDYGRIRTDEYFDWFRSPVIEGTDTTYQFLQRSADIDRNNSNFSWSVGYNYTPANWIFKLHAGKSFRMPTPQELAANGINYHYFRYESGDSKLAPEVSLQLDAGVEYNAKHFAIGTSPFLNYFSNYIIWIST